LNTTLVTKLKCRNCETVPTYLPSDIRTKTGLIWFHRRTASRPS